MEAKKQEALKAYREAQKAYMETMGRAEWIALCDAKRICRLLGCLI